MQSSPHPASPERLTTSEVLALLRISRATLWRRVAQGRLPRPLDRGRQALFCKAAVCEAALIEDGQRRSFRLKTEERLERFRRRKRRS
jgi:predicted DNA-binding transcriptional regulator AlpA